MLTAARRDAKAITRSGIDALVAPDFFLWATGIEDTFITDPNRRTGRTLDEYELTGHYTHWREDIGLIAKLGVDHARYGIPWYRVEPSPGEFDFSWIDQPLERLLEAGIQPIVDLVHYGTPEWLAGGFGNPEYPRRVAEYAARVAERYQGRVFWYTPLNEPRITAHYCGRLGWWPPYERGWSGFLKVLVAVCKGIVLTQRALREVDPEIVIAHVDATDIYTAANEAGKAAADLRQRIVFLPLDFVMGRVARSHPLYEWLLHHGVTQADLGWFAEHASEPDLVGINLYPMFSDKRVYGGRTHMRYGSAHLIDQVARRYWDRYRTPIFVSETAAIGRSRKRWLDDSLAAVRNLRAEGIPLVGYTWWPLFALIGWAYREKELPFERYLVQMGLWNLVPNAGDLARVATPLVECYQQAVAEGCGRVGQLRRSA